MTARRHGLCSTTATTVAAPRTESVQWCSKGFPYLPFSFPFSLLSFLPFTIFSTTLPFFFLHSLTFCLLHFPTLPFFSFLSLPFSHCSLFFFLSLSSCLPILSLFVKLSSPQNPALPAGSKAESQPKSNLLHYSLKI